jgi:hypothetical protein
MAAGTRGSTMGSPRRPRPLLDSARRATKPAPWANQRPHHQTDRPRRPTLPAPPRPNPHRGRTATAITPGRLTKPPPYQ